MSEVADRVMMRFAEAIETALDHPDIGLPSGTMLGRQAWLKAIAAALSSHGLREMVEALEEYARAERISQNCREVGLADGALKTALLGDPPTVKGEK